MKNLFLFVVLVALSSCLRTRADLNETDQTAVYSQKNANNQMDAQEQGQAQGSVVTQTQILEDKDDLIRQLNGRVEVLENQLTDLQKERQLEKQQNEEKLNLLQESLKKLEAQMTRTDFVATNASETSKDPTLASSDQQELKKTGTPPVVKASGEKNKSANGNSYEVAEAHFAKKEWKRAILSFHKYTDEAPKSKLIPDAKYKIGLSFQELGMKEEAMAYYEEVVANYGTTEVGKKAKSRLAKMKK